MNQQAILEAMKSYFSAKQPPEALQSFATIKPQALMPDSMDVVNFIVYLENAFNFHIDINQIGPALIDKNFGEVAGIIASKLPAESPGQ
jgi:hypothetical protein